MSWWTTPVSFSSPGDPPRFALVVGRILVVLGVLVSALPMLSAMIYVFFPDGTNRLTALGEMLSPPFILGMLLLLVGLLTVATGHLRVIAWRATRDDD